jgi:hypothetical protein
MEEKNFFLRSYAGRCDLDGISVEQSIRLDQVMG